MNISEIARGDQLIHRTCRCGNTCGPVVTVLEVEKPSAKITIRQPQGHVFDLSPGRLAALEEGEECAQGALAA